MSQPLQWFTDGGHGWLRVALDDLDGFQPSQYSYRDYGQFAFLEEDCDALGWADHTGRLEEAKVAPVSHTDGYSFVRNLPSF